MTRTRITTQAASGTGIYYCKIWTPIGWTYSLMHIYYFRIRRPESRYVDRICFPCLIAYVHTTDREEKETKVTCQIGLQCNSFTSSIRRRGCGRYVVEDTEYTVPGRSPTHTYMHHTHPWEQDRPPRSPNLASMTCLIGPTTRSTVQARVIVHMNCFFSFHPLTDIGAHI